jgi:hypothetical protein
MIEWVLGIVALVAAALGFFGGNAIGKSSGRKEGEQQARTEQSAVQNEKAAQAATERSHVEIEVAADSDDDLERRLQKHNRVD